MLQHSFIKFNSYLDVVICPVFPIKVGTTNTLTACINIFPISVVMLVYNNKTLLCGCVHVLYLCMVSGSGDGNFSFVFSRCYMK